MSAIGQFSFGGDEKVDFIWDEYADKVTIKTMTDEIHVSYQAARELRSAFNYLFIDRLSR